MLICMQKINFITQFFLKILQRNSKLVFWVIWASLATHTWNGNRNLKKPFTVICRQKIKFILHAFLEILQRYCKLIVTNPKWYYQLVENFLVYFQAKKQLHSSPVLFWRYCKNMQTSYFGYFGRVWLHTPKMTVSTCRRPRCLSACQK